MEDFKMSKEEMIEEIKKMTVVELADLVKAIEEEFGVSAVAAAAPVAAQAPVAAATPVAAKAPSAAPVVAAPASTPVEPKPWFCTSCGQKNSAMFCTACGTRKPVL